MSTIRIQTTQNVSLEYEVASVGDRALAAIIDNVILYAWIGAVIGLAAYFKAPDITMGVIAVVLCGIPYVFYNLASEMLFNGQSIGKKARNIKVVRLDGTPPRFGDYLIRWLLRIVDTVMFSGIVALVVVLANGRGQRIGDIAAGTAVVRVRARQAGGVLAPSFTEPGYVVVFPEAANLADHDVATVRQLLHKVKDLTGIRTDLPDEPFLRTVLRDHAHLAAQESPYA